MFALNYLIKKNYLITLSWYGLAFIRITILVIPKGKFIFLFLLFLYLLLQSITLCLLWVGQMQGVSLFIPCGIPSASIQFSYYPWLSGHPLIVHEISSLLAQQPLFVIDNWNNRFLPIPQISHYQWQYRNYGNNRWEKFLCCYSFVHSPLNFFQMLFWHRMDEKGKPFIIQVFPLLSFFRPSFLLKLAEL